MACDVFVVMRVGEKDSPERKRADEVFKYVVEPALAPFGLMPYRADLDYSPGAISPKILSNLVDSKYVIADLTGRNPNVFYELGIAHSFVKPVISLIDNISDLPFDTKDENVIVIGDYPQGGLGVSQADDAKDALGKALAIVTQDGYETESPLKTIAAAQSLDKLAPTNPVAAEMALMRTSIEALSKNQSEALRRQALPTRQSVPRAFLNELTAARAVIERNLSFLDRTDFEMLQSDLGSNSGRTWFKSLEDAWQKEQEAAAGIETGTGVDPWQSQADPWGAAPPNRSGLSNDEPPF